MGRGGERRAGPRGRRDVVEPGDSNVIRHVDAEPAQRDHRAEGNGVADREDRVGVRPAAQRFQGTRPAVLEAEVTRQDARGRLPEECR
jgi:hypothetical protein